MRHSADFGEVDITKQPRRQVIARSSLDE